jgi:hypothetical protein
MGLEEEYEPIPFDELTPTQQEKLKEVDAEYAKGLELCHTLEERTIMWEDYMKARIREGLWRKISVDVWLARAEISALAAVQTLNEVRALKELPPVEVTTLAV